MVERNPTFLKRSDNRPPERWEQGKTMRVFGSRSGVLNSECARVAGGFYC